MTSASFDFAPVLAAGLPAPAARWTGLAKYSFVGGNNDADQVPVDRLTAAVTAVLAREGRTLATYGLDSGPLGYLSIARVPRRQAQADGRHCLRQRRDPDHLGLAAGDRPGQRPAAGAGRHRPDRAGILSGLAEQADAARGQRRGHSARRGRDAHGCARGRARGATASRRPPQIHLHHPDRAESDRHHHGRAAPSRAAEAVGTIRRADLRGRLLRRPDLGRPPPAGALRHEQARRRHPYRLVLQVDRAGAAGRLHRGAAGRSSRASCRSRPTPAPARWSRWCWPNSAPAISTSTCRS